jgi:uncharacterized protein (DUF1778 family)
MKAQEPQARTQRVSARLTEKEMKAVTKAAKQTGTTIAEYVRLCVFG